MKVSKSILYKDIQRKSEHVKDMIQYYDGYPLFTIVEFNIWGACNRSCSFCPVSNPNVYTNKHEGISVDLYKKIIDDLANINYKGKIIYSAFSEPLLNKEVNILIEYSKNMLPHCYLEINSNGDVIKNNINKLLNLYESGLDCLLISIYDGIEEYNKFLEFQNDNNIPKDKFILRRRYFDKEKGEYGILFSNRAGTVDVSEFINHDDSVDEILPMKRTCFYPFYNIMIDYNGDMLLCPHDWAKELIIGNLATSNIFDLWTNKVLDSVRKRLTNKSREFSPCNKCNVRGDVMGKNSSEAWQKSNMFK